MNAIRALDPQERAKVLEFLLKLEADQARPSESDASFEEAARQVFSRHAELLQKLAP